MQDKSHNIKELKIEIVQAPLEPKYREEVSRYLPDGWTIEKINEIRSGQKNEVAPLDEAKIPDKTLEIAASTSKIPFTDKFFDPKDKEGKKLKKWVEMPAVNSVTELKRNEFQTGLDFLIRNPGATRATDNAVFYIDIQDKKNPIKQVIITRKSGPLAMPGGMLDGKETFKDAAIREFGEECIFGKKKEKELEGKERADWEELKNHLTQNYITGKNLNNGDGTATNFNWIETAVSSGILPQKFANSLQAGDDAEAISLKPVTPELYEGLKFGNHGVLILMNWKNIEKQIIEDLKTKYLNNEIGHDALSAAFSQLTNIQNTFVLNSAHRQHNEKQMYEGRSTDLAKELESILHAKTPIQLPQLHSSSNYHQPLSRTPSLSWRNIDDKNIESRLPEPADEDKQYTSLIARNIQKGNLEFVTDLFVKYLKMENGKFDLDKTKRGFPRLNDDDFILYKKISNAVALDHDANNYYSINQSTNKDYPRAKDDVYKNISEELSETEKKCAEILVDCLNNVLYSDCVNNDIKRHEEGEILKILTGEGVKMGSTKVKISSEATRSLPQGSIDKIEQITNCVTCRGNIPVINMKKYDKLDDEGKLLVELLVENLGEQAKGIQEISF